MKYEEQIASVEQLMQSISQKKWAPVYLLTGKETFYIDIVTETLENSILSDKDQEMNQTLFYGKDTTVTEVVNACRTYPFGTDYKVVFLKEAKDLKKIDSLSNYLPHFPSTTILVIAYKYGEASLTLKKAVKKQEGIVFLSEPINDWDLNKWVKQRVAYYHFQIDENATTVICEHVGNELSRIDGELKKLKIILPENTLITSDIIEKHISISKEYNVFELQEAIGTKNIQKAYKIILNFTQNPKDNPNEKLIPILYSFFYKMLRYHYMPNKVQAELFKLYNTKSAFMLNKQIGYANFYPPYHIQIIISYLREYDMKSKGVENNADKGELLKELIYKIMNI